MAAHRYWRIDITAVIAPQTNINMAEIQMASSVGGANLFGSGTALASSTQGGIYEPSAACDGDVTTWWSTPDPSLGWWGYDFGAGNSVVVNEVRIYPLDYSSVLYAPTAFTLDYSDDASAWTAVQAFTTAGWSVDTWQSFDVTVAPAAVRFRGLLGF